MANLKFSSEVVRNSEYVADGIVQSKNIKYPWPTYNSSILDYMLDFDPVLLDINLIDFLSTRQYPVVLDFLATPTAIKDLYMRANVTPGQGIAVGYEDQRSVQARRSDLLMYNTVQVTADLNDRETWKEVGEILQGDKADLIMQRGRGGIGNLPADKGYYNAARRHMWMALSEENGVLVSQVHNDEVLQRNGIDLFTWTEKVQKLGVDAKYVPGVSVEQRTNKKDCFGLLRLVRTPSAPTRLPLF